MKNNDVSGKMDALKSIIQSLGPMSVAFSGGVDSTFLLAFAHEIIGEKVQAIIARSPVFPKDEDDAAHVFLKKKGICYHVVEPELMTNDEFIRNDKNRCYVCKKILFKEIFQTALKTGKNVVVHGVNIDDFKDYRPGLKAADEMGVLSPLVDAGFTKQDIRDASRMMGLPTADKPSMACLASRIPYGDVLSLEMLGRVERSEALLTKLGFIGVRARHHGVLVRLEIPGKDFGRLLGEDIRKTVVSGLKELGYLHIALDLEGYTQGSMNRMLSL
ncbi:MAG: ATP-dependent sacrificial sulfur transferase LarE [Proteobacteria bacterium]|nr:ATP-dependent sacrificial sulfur transferase LarE [Pseudomonadota bacterium]